MVSVKPLTVILVGAHCSGKSTLGTKLARRLGFRFEAEIGETMLRANGLQQSLQDDESILKAEIERDRVAASKAAIGGGNRVVETWHPGNYAWAAARETPLANLGGWLERATLQAREEMERSHVLVLALNCSEETRRERRQSSGEVRLPRFGGAANEDEFMAVTLNIGKTALATARAMCGDAAVRELDTSGSVEETVNAAVRELLDMLMPVPEVEAAPLWFRSFSSAFDTLMVGARLLPELREELQRDGGLMRDTFAMAEAASVAGASKEFPALSVVAVEGLDGAGKSTLVQDLAKRLGACPARSPPPSLDRLRALLEAEGFSRDLRSLAASRIKRAFFTCGNYVFAAEAMSTWRKADGNAGHLPLSSSPSILIVDRFYGSTAAYTLGCAPSRPMAELPPDVWDWPSDLPAPAVVLVLRATEEVRMQRVWARAGLTSNGIGEWELRAERDRALGPNIMQAFSRLQEAWNSIESGGNAMRGDECSRASYHAPPTESVIADGSPGEVLETALDVLATHGIRPCVADP